MCTVGHEITPVVMKFSTDVAILYIVVMKLYDVVMKSTMYGIIS